MPNLLVIDDNPAVATALEVLFSLHDISTLHAQTPEAGLAMLQNESVELVIQDMNFSADTTSGDEGRELFAAIRQRHPDRLRGFPAFEADPDRLQLAGDRVVVAGFAQHRLRRGVLEDAQAAHASLLRSSSQPSRNSNASRWRRASAMVRPQAYSPWPSIR